MYESMKFYAVMCILDIHAYIYIETFDNIYIYTHHGNP